MSDDLAPPYGGARAWALGMDPYADSSVNRVLVEAGRETNGRGQAYFNPSLYPPPTYVVLAPLALTPWHAARLIFLAVCLALFAWHLPSLLRLAELSWRSTAGLWMLGCVIALAPYHTGIALGQVAIVSVTLLVVAIDDTQRGREVRGGTELALAAMV